MENKPMTNAFIKVMEFVLFMTVLGVIGFFALFVL
jgi:hypothetical protein